MKFNCFYKVTVTTCVPESITLFEDEEIYHWGYYPYNLVIKEVKELLSTSESNFSYFEPWF